MILLKSAFNLDFDLQLPRYGEIAKSEFIFCFIVFSLILFVSYINKNKKYTQASSWWLILFYCLYAFWDSDYFSMAMEFYNGLEGFRDPIYYYIQAVSLSSYIIFRFWVWGTALLLYYLLTKRFRLSPNKSIFIFAFFFLSTFCYGRVSLGMALYFWGLSFLLRRKHRLIENLLFALIFFILAYFAHRSIALLIVLTPLVCFKLTKRKIKIISIIAIISVLGLKTLIINILSSSIRGDNPVGKAALGYMKFSAEMNYNWKFLIMSYAQILSYVLLGIYIGYILISGNHLAIIPRWVKQLYNLTVAVLIIGLVFWTMPGFGLKVVGYRFIYMTGIPLCLMTTQLYEAKLTENKYFWSIMLLAIIYGEGFIMGKIISHS